MDTAQMGRRCGSGAELIGVTRLPGYRFIINKDSYATIVPDKDAEVYGAVWYIDDACENALDDYEDVPGGLYDKELQFIKLGDRSIPALIYIGASKESGRPGKAYMEKIIAAAQGHGFPVKYIEGLKTWLPEK
jgi:gamma-glutamylcyclotransferase (GGCT)/AIG2-like uncharacterized protein YtfP